MDTHNQQLSKFKNGKITEGILFVDKPTGYSSHYLVNWARINSGIKKIGHTGTLDPLATGLLILLVGRKYTKIQDTYLKLDKEYLCTARLGITTDSYDIVGQVTSKDDWKNISKVTKEKIEAVLPEFRGKIRQIVPIYSAVKIDGKKLYQIAAKAKYCEEAKEVAEKMLENLPSREVVIYELELTDFSLDLVSKEVEFSIRVFCSSGTFIRSLVHDIGQRLNVGATVTSLRRTKIGNISIKLAQICPFFLSNKS